MNVLWQAPYSRLRKLEGNVKMNVKCIKKETRTAKVAVRYGGCVPEMNVTWLIPGSQGW